MTLREKLARELWDFAYSGEWETTKVWECERVACFREADRIIKMVKGGGK
jgi:hypothetical protein